MFCLLAAVLLRPIPLLATNHTVKAGGGGNFSTIQACATAMGAGDTCTVYAGTYNENVTVSSGSAGNYKTMTVNASDLVYVYSFTIGSHVRLSGFHLQNPSSPSSGSCVSVSSSSTDFFITNNTMYACGSFITESNTVNSFGYIQGNTMSYSCSTSSSPNVCLGIKINGNNHLIENNDISHVSDGIYIFGAHNVIRKNKFHDVYSSDCGSSSSNCHIDFIQTDASVPATLPATYYLIENNTILNMVGSNMHSIGLFQGESCSGQCFNAIVRFNIAAHVGGGGIVDDNSLTSPPAWDNVKAYNNTWADVGNQVTGAGNGINGFTHGSTGGADVNDLFYFPFSLSNWDPYFTDSASLPFAFGHSLAYCTVSPCGLHAHMYGSGTWTDDPGNIMANPNFVNYAGNDFRLSAGSPAIAAGTYLTTVASSDSGSGSSLVVSDAGYFQDGYGISGVSADCIAVTTATNHVCITSVNYQTQTLTLAGGITRSAGDPVWLYSDSTQRTVLNGSAPNIGATFDPSQASAPAPPTGLAASVN